ncbi:hypothetical protein [Streptomyces sp. NBC_00620]|nr:hypothetical protein [Streptomyces sp. NBC_00620]MCX4972191.1 hypothetical protein [Streptomyces sp. NBC_00620]
MICSRCRRAITPGQPQRSFDKFSTSAGGFTFHYHLACLLKQIKR